MLRLCRQTPPARIRPRDRIYWRYRKRPRLLHTFALWARAEFRLPSTDAFVFSTNDPRRMSLLSANVSAVRIKSMLPPHHRQARPRPWQAEPEKERHKVRKSRPDLPTRATKYVLAIRSGRVGGSRK